MIKKKLESQVQDIYDKYAKDDVFLYIMLSEYSTFG